MIKILQVIDGLNYGGAERLLTDMLAERDVAAFEHQVVFLLPQQTALREKIEALGVPVHCVGIRTRFQYIKAIRSLQCLIKAHDIDIIHTHCHLSHIFGRLAGKFAHVPAVVSTLHNTSYEPAVFIDAPRYNRLKYWHEKWHDAFTGHIAVSRFIAVSHEVKRSFARQLGFSPQKISVVYNGVRPEDFTLQNVPVAPNVVREDLGIAPGAPVLLSVGRLVPQKGQRFMIEAMPRILQAFPAARLVLCGSGWMEKRLKALRDSLGLTEAVIFLPAREDVKSIYTMSDIFLCTSLYEGFGIVVCEAMASEKPVIAFDRPPLTELLRHDETGLLVKIDNVEAVSNAVIALLNDHERSARLGRAGRERVCEVFDIREKTKEVEEIYKSLDNTDGPRAA